MLFRITSKELMEPLMPGDSGLGIFVPENLVERVDRWRRVYDPYQHTILPHLTVAYPPFIPQREWLELRPALQACLGTLNPFRIHLKTLGSFPGSTSVLWFRPEDDGNLVRIHALLENHFPKYVPVSPLGYVPHLTVGFFDSSEALTQAQETILSAFEPFEFQVNAVTYMVLGDDRVWGSRDELLLEQTR